jgi:hypothetical protein
VPLRVSVLSFAERSVHKLEWILLALPFHPVKDGDVTASDAPLHRELGAGTDCQSSYQVPVEKLLFEVQRSALSKEAEDYEEAGEYNLHSDDRLDR